MYNSWAQGYGFYSNPDPDIVLKEYDNFYSEWIEFQIDRLNKPARTKNGFFVDSVSDYTKKDYDKEHWLNYNDPLSVDNHGDIYVDTRQSISKLLKHLQTNKTPKKNSWSIVQQWMLGLYHTQMLSYKKQQGI